MPSPKVPPVLKLLRGTLKSKDRAALDTPTLPPLDVPPTPPAWMHNRNARAEFTRLAPVLFANGLLTEGNIGLFNQFCAVHGRLADMWARDEEASAALIASYRALSNSLGLLHWNVPTAKTGNRFANHAKRAKLPTGAR